MIFKIAPVAAGAAVLFISVFFWTKDLEARSLKEECDIAASIAERQSQEAATKVADLNRIPDDDYVQLCRYGRTVGVPGFAKQVAEWEQISSYCGGPGESALTMLNKTRIQARINRNAVESDCAKAKSLTGSPTRTSDKNANSTAGTNDASSCVKIVHNKSATGNRISYKATNRCPFSINANIRSCYSPASNGTNKTNCEIKEEFLPRDGGVIFGESWGVQAVVLNAAAR